MSNQVKMVFAYENSEATRTYTLECAEDDLGGVKSKIKAINAGELPDLTATFIDNDGNGFSHIKSAQIISYKEENLPIEGGDE